MQSLVILCISEYCLYKLICYVGRLEIGLMKNGDKRARMDLCFGFFFSGSSCRALYRLVSMLRRFGFSTLKRSNRAK